MMNFLVDFKNNASEVEIASYMSNNGLTVVIEYDQFEKLYLVSSDTIPPVTNIVDFVEEDLSNDLRLLANETVDIDITAEENWWKTAVISDLDFDQNINTIMRPGPSQRIYLLDSGIDISHSEFEGSNIDLLYSITPDDFSDTTGHGTALASVMIGKTCGLSDSKLSVVKIFEQGRALLLSELVSAFNAVMADYAQNPTLMTVMNLSWSIERNAFIESRIKNMIDAGVIVVTSAGNEGRPVEDVTPAAMQEVITVGSFSKNLQLSDFTNYNPEISLTNGEVNFGPSVDYFAPGEFIKTAKVGGGYADGFGTSFSSAIVASIVAMRMEASGYKKSFGSFDPHAFVNIGVARGILEIDSRFSDPQNAIPVVDLTNFTTSVREMRLFTSTPGMTSAWMFNSSVNTGELIGAPEWAYLDGNFLIMDRPEIEGIEVVEMILRLTSIYNGTVTDHECVLVNHNSTIPVSDTKDELDIRFANWYECEDDCRSMGDRPYCCRCCFGSKGFPSYCTQCSPFQCMNIENC